MKATYKMQKNNLCVLCEKQGTLVKKYYSEAYGTPACL